MVWDERREHWATKGSDARDPGDVDYGRIIHSASFRRLQGKTQVLNLGDSDFYRTRLTHSLEVAQIAGGITAQLIHDAPEHDAVRFLPSRAMIQAIGSTHDLGHPPFGHGGEVALNYCMRDQGGFEGNGQTLRILTKLEKFSKSNGANLTRRTLLGSLKYPVSYSMVQSVDVVPRLASGTTAVSIIDRKACKPPKCYMDSEIDEVDWILDPLSLSDRDAFISVEAKPGKHAVARHKSLDCTIMDVADDIAFGVHDLEDMIAMRLVSRADFERYVTPDICASYIQYLRATYPTEFGNDPYGHLVGMLFDNNNTRKHAINRLVGHFVTNCRIVTLSEFQEPLLRYRVALVESAEKFLRALKDLVYEVVIQSPSVQHLEFKGQGMVVSVFEVMKSELLMFLPRDTQELFKKSAAPIRVICDHIAGMTDTFLLKTYDRLFSPRMGSVFDKL